MGIFSRIFKRNQVHMTDVVHTEEDAQHIEHKAAQHGEAPPETSPFVSADETQAEGNVVQQDVAAKDSPFFTE